MDGEHTRRRILAAVGQEKEEQERVETLICAAVEGCEVCPKHGWHAGRPRSGGLLAKNPNQIIAMDSFDLDLPEGDAGEKGKCLRVADVATKFSRVCVVLAHNDREVASTLYDWMSMFPIPPDVLFAGQGTELKSKDVANLTVLNSHPRTCAPRKPPRGFTTQTTSRSLAQL